MPVQRLWRFCSKCFAMFYAGNASQGVCPAGGSHLAQGFDFALPFNVPQSANAQPDWRFCEKCEAMFYQGPPPSPGESYSNQGVCSAGGEHLAQGIEFVLPHDVPITTDTQAFWHFCSKCGVMFFSGFAAQGVCQAGGDHLAQGYDFVLPFGQEGREPTPAGGLGSSHNYFLDAFCNRITNLNVRIAITEELIAVGGWSFQLNCYSPLGETVQWQQYVIRLEPFAAITPFNPITLVAVINNWGASSTNPLAYLQAALGPETLAILPGYFLQIDLLFDGNANVTGAEFLFAGAGGTISSTTINLPPVQVIAPIIAFQLNLVGPYNGMITNFAGGAGTITYFAKPDLRVQSQRPSCAMSTFITQEQGNSFYGPLPASGGGTLIQSFNTSSAVPMIRRLSTEPAPSLKR